MSVGAVEAGVAAGLLGAGERREGEGGEGGEDGGLHVLDDGQFEFGKSVRVPERTSAARGLSGRRPGG